MDAVIPALTEAVGDFVTQGGLVIGIGMGVVGLIWGAPKLVGFFKRIAK